MFNGALPPAEVSKGDSSTRGPYIWLRPAGRAVTRKSQVTILKQICDALNVTPGCPLRSPVNHDGAVVLQKTDRRSTRKPDWFDAVRGKACVK